MHADAGAAGEVLADRGPRRPPPRTSPRWRRRLGARSRSAAATRVEVDGRSGTRTRSIAGGARRPRRRGSRWAPRGSGGGRPVRAASGRSRAVARSSSSASRSPSACRSSRPVPSTSLVDRRRDERHGDASASTRAPSAEPWPPITTRPSRPRASSACTARVAPGRGLERLPAARAEPGARLVRVRARLVAGHAEPRAARQAPRSRRWMPQASPPMRSARSHTPAIAAFMPGASPPLVRTPRRSRRSG